MRGIFLLVPHFFEAGNSGTVSSSRVYSLMGNVVLAAPLSWNECGLRPFVSGGLGLMHATQTTIPNMLPLSENLLRIQRRRGAVGFITRHTGREGSICATTAA